MERSVVPPRSIPSKDMAPAPSEVTLFLGPGNSVPNSSTCGVKTTFIRPRNIAWPEMGWRTPPGRERLVFFVDLHCDEHQLSWPTLAGPPGTQSNNMTLELFKQCISLITMTRSRMDVDTEFSLCVLLDSAVCISDLTIDASEFLKQVNQLSGLERFESLDLASALAVLRQKSAEVLAKDADSQQQKTPVLVRGSFCTPAQTSFRRLTAASGSKRQPTNASCWTRCTCISSGHPGATVQSWTCSHAPLQRTQRTKRTQYLQPLPQRRAHHRTSSLRHSTRKRFCAVPLCCRRQRVSAHRSQKG